MVLSGQQRFEFSAFVKPRLPCRLLSKINEIQPDMKITLILQMRNSPLTCPAGIESEWEKFYSVEGERFLSADGVLERKERENVKYSIVCGEGCFVLKSIRPWSVRRYALTDGR